MLYYYGEGILHLISPLNSLPKTSSLEFTSRHDSYDDIDDIEMDQFQFQPGIYLPSLNLLKMYLKGEDARTINVLQEVFKGAPNLSRLELQISNLPNDFILTQRRCSNLKSLFIDNQTAVDFLTPGHSVLPLSSSCNLESLSYLRYKKVDFPLVGFLEVIRQNSPNLLHFTFGLEESDGEGDL